MRAAGGIQAELGEFYLFGKASPLIVRVLQPSSKWVCGANKADSEECRHIP
jgi:hypothetical protein